MADIQELDWLQGAVMVIIGFTFMALLTKLGGYWPWTDKMP